MNRGLVLLAATSNYLNYRRFENIFKLVTTYAGKDVARSKKVTDNARKEFMLLAPKPIKGKRSTKLRCLAASSPTSLNKRK